MCQAYSKCFPNIITSLDPTTAYSYPHLMLRNEVLCEDSGNPKCSQASLPIPSLPHLPAGCPNAATPLLARRVFLTVAHTEGKAISRGPPQP